MTPQLFVRGLLHWCHSCIFAFRFVGTVWTSTAMEHVSCSNTTLTRSPPPNSNHINIEWILEARENRSRQQRTGLQNIATKKEKVEKEINSKDIKIGWIGKPSQHLLIIIITLTKAPTNVNNLLDCSSGTRLVQLKIHVMFWWEICNNLHYVQIGFLQEWISDFRSKYLH